MLPSHESCVTTNIKMRRRRLPLLGSFFLSRVTTQENPEKNVGAKGDEVSDKTMPKSSFGASSPHRLCFPPFEEVQLKKLQGEEAPFPAP